MQSIRNQDENVALVEIPIFAPLPIPPSNVAVQVESSIARVWEEIPVQAERQESGGSRLFSKHGPSFSQADPIGDGSKKSSTSTLPSGHISD